MRSAASRLSHIAAATAGGNADGESSEPPPTGPAAAQEDDGISSGDMGYRLPPKEIQDIVDAPPLPVLSFSPNKDKILFLKRRALPPLSDLAKPEEKLAGLRIDGNSNTRSRMSFYTGIGIHKLLDDGTLGPEKEVYGYPVGARINFVTWSQDGRHISFTVRVDEEDNKSGKLRVWFADVESGEARPLFKSPDIYLNAIFDSFVWVNNSTLLVCTIPMTRGALPQKPSVPSGPKIQSNETKNVVQVRTFQDLLKDEHDADLFDYYATSQLVLASLDGTVKPIGPPAVYTSIDPSPDDKYLMVSSIHRPYSYIVPCGRFPKKVELWTVDGMFIRELCDLPLAEDIPITMSSVRKGKRSINWRADKPSTLYWVETQDGGDAKVEVSPRDIVYMENAEPINGEQPEILHKLDLRYAGTSWCDESLALMYESWYKTRKTRTWVLSPDKKDVSPRILFDRSSEDVYSDPGSPMLRRTDMGTYVIAKIKKQGGSTYVLLNGMGATPEGNVPFLDLFDINTGSKERIWESDKEKYYETVVALMSDKTDGELSFDQLKILTSKESKTENTQYYLQTWPEKKQVKITNFPHPYPQLASLYKEMIRYQRKDGVQLTANLYLPPGYDPSKDGPLPCLVWSYPGEFKSKDAAGQVRGSPNEFPGIGATSPLLWLARGFAILSGPTIPIIGEGDEEANDRYVEQLVASAEAAVEEVVKRGVAHPDKIAVGGHSYGAFMTANLLAHASHLFCCGIARSGAYNRTLTPFGFQNECGAVPRQAEEGALLHQCSPHQATTAPPPPRLRVRPLRAGRCGFARSPESFHFRAGIGGGVLAWIGKPLQKPRGGVVVVVAVSDPALPGLIGQEGRNCGGPEMMHAKSESDVTSLAASSPPRSPKRGGGGVGAGAGGNGYYVQSPSRESHDGGYKSSSMQATPVYNSPNESPSHPSYGRHSRSSSVSRFSGNLRKGGAGGERKALNDKGWPECNVIEEEGPYEDLAGDSGLSRRCQIILGFLTFVLLFTVFCLIIWGAARPYEPEVIVKSLVMDDFYAGEGTDHSGVPTKLVTTNCSLHISVYNPATMFGIHVTSGPIHLIYSEISIATGQLRRYYQPRKSHRMVTAVIHGEKVPLYGAGGGLMLSSTGGAVPLKVDFDLTSRGYVIGKLVRVTHKVHVTCPVVVDAKKTKPIRFSKKACAVYKA